MRNSGYHTVGNPTHRKVIALLDQATLRDVVTQEQARTKRQVARSGGEGGEQGGKSGEEEIG